MYSTFMGVEIGKRGVLAHQSALNTISNNLANSSNESYSRQEVTMGTLPPLYSPSLNREMGAGQMGQGAEVVSIKRVRDEFIDGRIVEEGSVLGQYDMRYKFLKQIEQIFNEPGKPSLKEKYDDYVKSWNDVAVNPEEGAAREALLTSSQNMLGFIKDHYQNLQKLRTHVDGMVREKVGEINTLAKQVRDLNVEILKVQAMGDNPNNLLDKRDALIEKISKMTDIKVVNNGAANEIIVYMGARPLIQGTKVNEILTVNNPENNGMANLIWENTGDPVVLKNGELKGLMEVRDQDILGAMKKLDNFVINLTESVNEIHKNGFGLNPVTGLNFFVYKSITGNANGNYDANKDGQVESTMLYKVTGKEKFKGHEQIGESGFINFGPDSSGKDVIVGYKETDKVQDVLDRINSSKARVTSYLDHQGRVVIKALYNENAKGADFALAHLEDTGHFLTSFAGILKQSGAAGAFDMKKIDQVNQLVTNNFTVAYEKNASMWASVDDSILRNSMNIAVRTGKDSDGDGILDMPNGRGDGSNAFRIISILVSENQKNGLDKNTNMDHMPVMVDKNAASFRPFLDAFVANIGEQAKSDKMNLEKENTLMTGLKNIREGISGVNIDEELVNLIKYQHGYQASAKIINTMNEMLDVIMKLGR